MLRSELVGELERQLPAAQNVDFLVKLVFDEIAEALARGDRVEIRGFGAFSVRSRKARQGRNPRTGAAVEVKAKKVPFFKPGSALRDRVNRFPNGRAD